jgi:hypothetical protein
VVGFRRIEKTVKRIIELGCKTIKIIQLEQHRKQEK